MISYRTLASPSNRRRHLDSVRHRADLSAVTLRPGLCRLWRLVHHSIHTLGVARRPRGAGSIRCHRGDGVPRWRDGDDVLAEVKKASLGYLPHNDLSDARSYGQRWPHCMALRKMEKKKVGLAVPCARATRGRGLPSLDART